MLWKKWEKWMNDVAYQFFSHTHTHTHTHTYIYIHWERGRKTKENTLIYYFFIKAIVHYHDCLHSKLELDIYLELYTPTASLQGDKTPTPTNVLDMKINHLMVRLQPWSFEEYGVPFHCHWFLVHSDMEYMLGSHLWVK